MEAGSFADLSLGILESAISPDEEALRENNLMEDDLEEDLQGADDHEADEDEMALSENDENDLEEFLVESVQSLTS